MAKLKKMKESKPSEWGREVDKSNATKEFHLISTGIRYDHYDNYSNKNAYSKKKGEIFEASK